MSRRMWLLSAGLALFLNNAYPVYQLVTAHGHLFYRNAFDETTYLQYNQTQSAWRATQYLVTMAHRIGLSGGWINLVLDVLSFVAFIVTVKAILSRVGFEDQKARLCSFIVTLLPLLFLTSNSVIRHLWDWSFTKGLIRWIIVPAADFLPLVRSPEPQVSLVLICFSLFLSLKYKSFLLAYVAMPFLYPFVSVPAAFTLLGFHIRTRIPALRRCSAVPPLLSFVIISSGLGIYYRSLTTGSAKEFLMQTHAPLLSTLGLLSLLAYLGVHKKIEEPGRYFALLISLAPTAVANHQLLSGYIAEPIQFEEYFGVYCIPVILVLALKHEKLPARAAALLGALMLILSASNTFDSNNSVNRGLVLSDEMLSVLKRDSGHVAFSDAELASRAGMLFPRQPATLFAYAKTYASPRTLENFAEYSCAKRALLRKPETARAFRGIFDVLDAAYRYESRDFILLHLGLKQSFELVHDPDHVPRSCPGANYWLATRPGAIEALVQKPFHLYTSPVDLQVPYRLLEHRVPIPVAQDLVLQADTVRIQADRWVVNGARPGLLAQTTKRHVSKGDCLVILGELRQGNISFGLIKDNQWIRSISVSEPGDFDIVMEMPEEGDYGFAMSGPEIASAAYADLEVTQAGWADRLQSDLYTVPADLPADMFKRLLAQELSPVSDLGIAYQAAIIRHEANQWIVKGQAEGAYRYLLSTRERAFQKGACFLSQGELRKGGMTLGLVRSGAWAIQVNVVRTGPFTVIIEIPENGTYSFILANYLRSGSLTNDFSLTTLGWAER